MLGLHDHVDGGQLRGRGLVGHDHHLGRTGEGPGHTHDPLGTHLALGRGHVHVARAHDDVGGWDGLGAVGHGGDGLGAAHPVHGVDPRQGGGREDPVGEAAVGAGRRAQDDLTHSRHPRRGRRHQHRRQQGRPPARDVDAGPVDRAAQVADGDPVAHVGVLIAELVPVVGEDGALGRLERLPQEGREVGQGPVELALVDAELVHGGAVEALGVLADGGVASLPDVGQDLAHHLDGRRPAQVGTGQAGAQIVARTAKIEAREHATMVGRTASG